MILKSGWCCWVTNRSGWLLELLAELKIPSEIEVAPRYEQKKGRMTGWAGLRLL